HELMGIANVDGALIGGASLKAADSHGEAMRPVGRASFRQGKGDRLGRTKGYARRQSPLP
ncbi:hypothetical protein ACCS60_34675, partial [Rhizobium acaciae]